MDGAHILPAAFGIPAESEPLAEVAQLLSGAQPLESFVRLMEEELARAR